jgi:hypothetical protein
MVTTRATTYCMSATLVDVSTLTGLTKLRYNNMELVGPWMEEHQSLVEHNYIDLGRPRKKGDTTI